MTRMIVIGALVTAMLSTGTMLAIDSSAAPAKLVFQAKPGAVTFDHAKHAEAAANGCDTCHPGLWPAKQGDLGFKTAMHKKAESEQTSCAACHRPEGQAFPTQGNCKRCHVKE